MELGMIGLGKMGAFMTERLVRGGHRVVGFDRDAAAVQRVVDKGAVGVDSLEKTDRATEGAASDLADGSLGCAGGPDDRSADAASRAGRHDHRRRQFVLSGFACGAPPHWRKRN